MLVKFYDDNTTRVFGRVAFPPRGFVPEEGAVYDVEISGENQKKTVFFLRVKARIGRLDGFVNAIGKFENSRGYDSFVYNSNNAPFSVFSYLPCAEAKPLYTAVGRGPILARAINEFIQNLCSGKIDVSDFPVVDVNPIVVIADSSQPYWTVNVFPIKPDSGSIEFTVFADDTIRGNYRESGANIVSNHFYLRPGQYLLTVKPTKTFHGLAVLNVMDDVVPSTNGEFVVVAPSRVSNVAGWASNSVVYHYD